MASGNLRPTTVFVTFQQVSTCIFWCLSEVEYSAITLQVIWSLPHDPQIEFFHLEYKLFPEANSCLCLPIHTDYEAFKNTWK